MYASYLKHHDEKKTHAIAKASISLHCMRNCVKNITHLKLLGIIRLIYRHVDKRFVHSFAKLTPFLSLSFLPLTNKTLLIFSVIETWTGCLNQWFMMLDKIPSFDITHDMHNLPIVFEMVNIILNEVRFINQ